MLWTAKKSPGWRPPSPKLVRISRFSRSMTYTFMFFPSARYMYFCSGSREKAMSHVDPSPSVRGAIRTSSTNVPSFWKTWIRSLGRSHTYTKPSSEGSAQCTGVRNCWMSGASGS